jgi:hypothetical protein
VGGAKYSVLRIIYTTGKSGKARLDQNTTHSVPEASTPHPTAAEEGMQQSRVTFNDKQQVENFKSFAHQFNNDREAANALRPAKAGINEQSEKGTQWRCSGQARICCIIPMTVRRSS